jgi:hypothetical protein
VIEVSGTEIDCVLSPYSIRSWIDVAARSDMNSGVNTDTTLATLRSSVFMRLPARVFEAR